MKTCCDWKLSFVAVGLLCLVGCQNIPAGSSTTNYAEVRSVQLLQPGVNSRLLTGGEPVSIESIFTLTDAQAESFLWTFHHELSHLPEHLRLAHYLERLTASYNYRERTLPARDAFAGEPGNCISLVVLTTALAQLVDLDIDYQRLTTNPIFDHQNGLILVSDHVRSRVYAPQKEGPVLMRAHAVIDYFPSRASRSAERLDMNKLLALYYSNLSAESILEDSLSAATGYAQMALKIWPGHPSALNLLAILHRRIGDEDTAEAYFQYALSLYPDDLNMLNNYHVLLKSQGRQSEATKLAERLLKLDKVNPYQLIALAQQAFNRGEFRRALRYYDQVLQVAPYLHEVYFQQSVVYEHLGQTNRANLALQEGIEQARMAGTEASYKRRLSAIKINSDHVW